MAALLLVDCLTDVRPLVDEALYAELRGHFDDGQILELGAALSVASGWQRFIEAFGIRPDAWTRSTPLPWQASGAEVADRRRGRPQGELPCSM